MSVSAWAARIQVRTARRVSGSPGSPTIRWVRTPAWRRAPSVASRPTLPGKRPLLLDSERIGASRPTVFTSGQTKNGKFHTLKQRISERQPARRSRSPTSCAVRTDLTVSGATTISGTCPSSSATSSRIASAQRCRTSRFSASLSEFTWGRSSLIITRPIGVLRMYRTSSSVGKAAGGPPSRSPCHRQRRSRDRRRDQQLMDRRLIHVRLGGHDRASVDEVRHRLVFDQIHHLLHAQIADPERVLDDQRRHLALGQRAHLVGSVVKADHLHLADQPALEQGVDDADHPRLVGGEDALEVRMGGEDVLHLRQRGVDVTLVVLDGDQMDVRVLLELLLKALLTLDRGGRRGNEREQGDV